MTLPSRVIDRAVRVCVLDMQFVSLDELSDSDLNSTVTITPRYLRSFLLELSGILVHYVLEDWFIVTRGHYLQWRLVRPLCCSINVHFAKLQCKFGQELLPLLRLAEPFASYELEP